METYQIDKDITVYCLTAKSFPEGIFDAHKRLHALAEFSTERKYYGISRPDKGGEIIYKAAMTEIRKGEFKEFNLEEFTIKKGNYMGKIIKDFMKDISVIGNTFEKIIQDDSIDPQGACIEWYLNETDVQCMVRMKDVI